MANILIIFKNYNVETLPKTWNFLKKFEKKFKHLTGESNP